MLTPCQSVHPSAPPESFYADPGNDKTSNTPDMAMTQDEADTNRIIMAINKLIQSHTSMSKPKLWEPNPFDGSNPKKLCAFIFQYKLNFGTARTSSALKKTSQLCPFPPEGSHIGLFQTHIFVPAQPHLALRFQSLCHRTRKQLLDLLTLKVKQKWNSRHFTCMKITRTKYFIKFQQLAS